MSSRHIGGYDRSNFEADEVSTLVSRFPKVHSNVGTGEERPESGHLAAGDSRPNNPESGIVYQIRLGFLDELNRRDDPLSFLVEFERFDFPNVKALEFDLGFAGFEAFGGFERDRNRRTLVQNPFDDDPPADQRGDNGNQPHQLGRRPSLSGSHRSWNIRQFCTARSFKHDASLSAPRGAADQRPSQQTWSTQPRHRTRPRPDQVEW